MDAAAGMTIGPESEEPQASTASADEQARRSLPTDDFVQNTRVIFTANRTGTYRVTFRAGDETFETLYIPVKR